MPALTDGTTVGLVRGARVPAVVLGGTPHGEPDADGLVPAEIALSGGKIMAVRASMQPPAGDAHPPAGAPVPDAVVDLDGGIVLPCFSDVHTHIDKGHIWPRTPNPDGTFPSALQAAGADRVAHWSAADVTRRMDFSLRCAFAHGTRRLRTHIDSIPPQDGISWPVFAEMREAWQGRITLQGVSLVGIEGLPEGPAVEDFARHVIAHGGILGAVLYPSDALEAGTDRLFEIAMRLDVDLDFHVDENGEPGSAALDLVARKVIETGFPGARVTCGHACSLAVQSPDVAEATIERVAEAGLNVVSLPMCNAYLQDRADGRTPRWRGVTLLRELQAAGVRTAVASDNTRDPFYAYGDLDMVEVLREATRILHLDHPVAGCAAAVTTAPAGIMGAAGASLIASGAPADLVLFRARTWTEFFARPQADRIVLRDGRVSRAALPDYRELDDLLASSAAIGQPGARTEPAKKAGAIGNGRY